MYQPAKSVIRLQVQRQKELTIMFPNAQAAITTNTPVALITETGLPEQEHLLVPHLQRVSQHQILQQKQRPNVLPVTITKPREPFPLETGLPGIWITLAVP